MDVHTTRFAMSCRTHVRGSVGRRRRRRRPYNQTWLNKLLVVRPTGVTLFEVVRGGSGGRVSADRCGASITNAHQVVNILYCSILYQILDDVTPRSLVGNVCKQILFVELTTTRTKSNTSCYDPSYRGCYLLHTACRFRYFRNLKSRFIGSVFVNVIQFCLLLLLLAVKDSYATKILMFSDFPD
jgi:hypothetical protein